MESVGTSSSGKKRIGSGTSCSSGHRRRVRETDFVLFFNTQRRKQVDNQQIHTVSGMSVTYMNGEQSNILLVILDSVRAKNTSLHGHPIETTPNLTSFAENATKYTQA